MRGSWHCDWCQTGEPGIGCKAAYGPKGPETLCKSCGTFYKAGFRCAPKKNPDGSLICPNCPAPLKDLRKLLAHIPKCDHGEWSCRWCACKSWETTGKRPGPPKRANVGTSGSSSSGSSSSGSSSGSSTTIDNSNNQDTVQTRAVNELIVVADEDNVLCVTCSKQYKRNRSREPKRHPETNQFICGKRRCKQMFNSMVEWRQHRTGCTSDRWSCDWCKIDGTHENTNRRKMGPKGKLSRNPRNPRNPLSSKCLVF